MPGLKPGLISETKARATADSYGMTNKKGNSRFPIRLRSGRLCGNGRKKSKNNGKTRFVRRCLKPAFWAALDVRAKDGAEKVVAVPKNVSPRLKPYCSGSTYGTGKPVPLTKEDFFSTV
jgi:hypothetical protein